MTNVLLIYADDMRFDFLPYMPNVQNLLVRQGTSFTQARANVGVCQPSRVGLLTGQWAVSNGVFGGFAAIDQDELLARWLHENGYRTGLFGKYLNSEGARMGPRGWDTWRQLVPEQSAYGYQVSVTSWTDPPSNPVIVTPGLAATDYLQQEVEAFIADSDPHPWFCYLAPSSPHSPFNGPPDEPFAWSHVKWPIERELDLAGKPSWFSETTTAGIASTDVPTFQSTARGQLRELTWLDRAIGSIVTNMSPTVLADTVIIFSSDNGLYYGEHRVTAGGIAKHDLYDVSLRVPCVIKGPQFDAGATNDALVSTGADLAATICAIADVHPENSPWDRATDGIDLRTPVDRAILCQRLGGGTGVNQFNPNPNTGDAAIVETPEHGRRKLMHWFPPGGAWHSLPLGDRYEAYDLDSDPHEHLNWANDPARAGERFDLVNQLRVLLGLAPFSLQSEL